MDNVHVHAHAALRDWLDQRMGTQHAPPLETADTTRSPKGTTLVFVLGQVLIIGTPSTRAQHATSPSFSSTQSFILNGYAVDRR